MPSLFQDTINSTLIPTKVASEISGYNADYLARLCRENKIEGTQVGRSWLINRSSLEAFVAEQEDRKKQRAEELRAQRGKEYRKAQKPILKATLSKTADMRDVVVRTAETARTVARHAFDTKTNSPQYSYSPRLAALAVALAVVAGSAYASADSRITTAFTSATNGAVRIAFNLGPGLVHSSSFRITEADAPVNVAQAVPTVPAAQTASRTITRSVPNANVAALASVRALTDDARVPFAQTSVASVAASRIALTSDFAHHPISSIVRGYVLTGELAYNVGASIGNAYIGGISATGDRALDRAATLRDGIAFIPRITNGILDGYANGIYAWNDAASKAPTATMLALYTLGDSLSSKTAAVPAVAERAQMTIAYNAEQTARTGATALAIALSADASVPHMAAASTSNASPLAASVGSVTRPFTTAYGKAVSAGGAILSLPMQAEDTILGVAGYASSLMDGAEGSGVGMASAANSSEVATAAPAPSTLSASIISSLPGALQRLIADFVHSTGALAGAFLSSTFHTIAYFFPNGTTIAPALTVLHTGPTEALALPTPVPSEVAGGSNGGTSEIAIAGGNRTIVQNIINNYFPNSIPGTLVGGAFDDAVLAVVRPFVNASIEASLKNNRGSGSSNNSGGNTSTGGVNSDGATLTNVTISSGTASLSSLTSSSASLGSTTATNLTAGASSLGTTTVNGNLTITGTITASSLAVGSLSYGGAVVAPYFQATDTAATSSFQTLEATKFALGGNSFTSLLGTGLSNIGGFLSVSTTSFSGSGSNFNADLLDGYDASYLLANSFSTSSANAWLMGETTDALAEGSVNQYFTTARARSALSVSGTGLSYSTTTGAFSLGTVPIANGGTNATSQTANGVAYFDGTSLTTGTGLTFVGGKLGIGSTTPASQLSVNGNALISGGLTATSLTAGSIASTGAANVGSLSIGSLTGFLKATAGVVSTSLVDLSTDVSSTLPVSHGGTGSTSLTGLLKGNGTSALLTAVSGVDYAPATIGSSILAGNGSGGFSTVNVASPLTFVGTTLGIQVANGSQNGYLSSSDWNTFNGKQAALAFAYPLVNTANTVSFAPGTSTATLGTGLSYSGTLGSFVGGTSGTLSISTTSFSGSGSNFNADLLDGLDSTYFLANSFSSTSAAYYLAQNAISGFSTTSADYWKTQNNFYSSTSADYWFSTKTTDNLAQGTTNLYFSNALARSALSSSATGLSYSTTTGTFSLTSGYTIPLTASTTDWNTAYVNRITAANAPLSLSNNTLSISQASASTAGYLSTADWATFNNKVSSTSLSAIYPLAYNPTTGVFSTAFSTTTTNVFSALNTFNGGINIGASTFTSLLGTGLSNIGGTLTIATSSFSGSGSNFNADLLDGLDSTYFLANAFSTTSANYWKGVNNFYSTTSADYWLTGKSTSNLTEGSNLYYTPARVAGVIAGTTTDALVEGITNLYFTNARADARINATSTISTLTSAPNLGTVKTSLTGLIKASAGVLSAAVSGTDYAPATTGASILAGNNAGGFNSVSVSSPLTFTGGNTLGIQIASGSQAGALAAADWATFNNKVSSTSLSATTGISYNSATGVFANTGVLSFNSRTGAVTPQSGDYTTDIVTEGTTNLYFTSARATANFVSNLSATTSVASISALPNLSLPLSQTTGVLTQAHGGTGISSYTPGDVLYADNSGNLAVLPVGSSGQVLKVQGGLPSWGVDQTVGGGGSDGVFATSTGKIYPLDTSQVFLLGTNATSTLNSIFEVNGLSYFSNKIGIGTTSPAQLLSVQGNGLLSGTLTAGDIIDTGATANTIAYFNGNKQLATTTVSAPLTFTGGALGIQVANGSQNGYLSNTDWTTFNGKLGSSTISSLTTNYVSKWNGSAFVNSLVFDTGTNVGIGSSSPFAKLSVAGDTYIGGNLTATGTVAFTGLGSGLVKAASGVLGLAVDGTDFISPSTFGAQFYNYFHATTTDALAEGSTNQYWTSTRFDTRLSATTSLPNITTLANLGTVKTSLSGLLKASSGVLSAAVSGTDYAPATIGSNLLYGNGAGGFSQATVSAPLTFTGGALGIQTASGSQDGALSAADWTTFNNKQAALTFTYPIVNTANTISLAFGTTTANSWSSLQTFNGGVKVGSLSGVFYGAAGTLNSVSTSTPTLGTGLSYSGTLGSFIGGTSGTLSVATSSFSGSGSNFNADLLDGLDSNYFTSNAYSTTSANYWLTTKTTDNLTEGTTNLYFTNARADARINATSTIGTLTSAPNLGTVKTSLSGLIKATAGVLSAAVSATDYAPATTGSSILAGNGAGGFNTVTVNAPLTFTGGNTLGIQQAAADGSTLGAAAFNANDFNAASGVITLDYTNGQKANGSQSGFLSSTDWTTFNNKVSSTSLSATYPVQYNSGTGVFSLAFGTTTSNTWGGTQIFTNAPQLGSLTGVIYGNSGTLSSTATSSIALGTGLSYSGTLGSFVGGLAGTLSVATSSFSGSGSKFNADLLDGFDSTYFTANSYSTTSANYWLTTKTTTDLAEGTNLYFTNARADARINATSTIGTLTSAPSLGTVSTALTGLLKATSGVLSSATAGTDYENPLTFSYPLTRTTNTISLAFGTTTANTWNSLQTFSGGINVTGNTTLANATSTNEFSGRVTANTAAFGQTGSTTVSSTGALTTPSLTVGSLSGVLYGASGVVNSTATSTPTLGTGLSYSGTLGSFVGGTSGTLSVSTSTISGSGSNFNADLLDGFDSTYFIANAYSTTSANYWLTTKTTDNLAEGSTNQYWTNTRFDTRLSATTSLPNITTLANLGTVKTSLTGLLKATSGVLSVAVSGTDYAPATSGSSLLFGNGAGGFNTGSVSSPLTLVGTTLGIQKADNTQPGYLSSSDWTTFNGKQDALTFSYPLVNTANTISLAFGTTTANTWSSLQTFSGGINVTGNTTLANATSTNEFSGRVTANTAAFGQTGSTTVSSTGALTTPSLTVGSLSGLLKASSGVVSTAVSGTDYAPATTGSSILAGNGAGGFNTVSVSSPLTFTGGNTLGIQKADNTQPGYLSSTDWSTFNGKQDALTFSYPIVNTANTISLAFGTTTTNSWSSLQTFNGGVKVGALSGVFYGGSGTLNSVATSTPTLGTGLSYSGTLGSFIGGTSGTLSISTSTFSGSGSNFNADLLDGQDGTYYLNRANHTGTQLAATISDFSTTARGLLSSTATGLTYTSGTGVFSLTAGYSIPLTASTTDWNTAYLNRITSATYPLQISSNAISLAFGTTTANSWSLLQTFNGGITTAGTITLGSLTGVLHASSSVVSASNVNLASEVTGTLPVANGGTGSTTLTGLLKGNGTGGVQTAVAGTDYQAAGNYITALTGDVTASGPGSAAATLATVNSNVGSFGGSTAIPTFTVNAKGLITAAGSVAVIAPAGTLTGTTLASNVVTSSLTSVGTLSALTVSGNTTLANATSTNEFSGRLTANTAAFGQTGSTTISSTGALTTPSLTIGSLSGVLYGASGAVNSVATSTATLGSGLAYTGTLGSFIGGAAGTLSVSGLTTSNFASANISQWTNDSGYLTASGAVTGIKQTYGTNQVGAITLATSSAATSNGVTVGLGITNSSGTFTFAPTVTVANIPNSALQNSSISLGGVSVSLGGNVAQPAFDLTNATNLPIVAGTTGTLTVARGGTGWTSVQSGALLYGNGTSALSTTTAGTAGQVLALLNGVPAWTSTTTAGTGLTYSAGSFNVNTTQNIAKLSNLTTNGFVKTTNGDGTLSIDTNTYLTSAITAIGPAGQTQTGSTITLASSTAGTDFSITASGNTISFNLPTASASNRGLLSSADWSTFNNKQAAITGTTGQFPYFSGTNTLTATSSLFLAASGNVGIGSTSPNALLTLQAASPVISIYDTAGAAQPWQIRSSTAGGVNAPSGNLEFYDPKTSKVQLSITAGGNNNGMVIIGSSTNNVLGNNSRLFIFGNSNGANVDLMGDKTLSGGIADQSQFEAEGADWGGANTNSIAIRYFGNSYPNGLTTFLTGLTSHNTGLLDFGSADNSIIRTATNTPLLIGVNLNEVARFTSAGLSIGTTTSNRTLAVGGSFGLSGAFYDGNFTAGTNGQVLQTTGSGVQWVSTSTLGIPAGTVTSVAASGGTTGLSFSGGPITSSGTLTLSGTLNVANGGTGSTTLTGILGGNGTSGVKTIVIGSGLTFDGTTLATSGAGITSIGPAGQLQTGGTQTLATTTSTFNGLTAGITITASGNVQTFQPTLSGTLTAGGGGTGISNPTAAGVLVGSYAGGSYQQIATSSLGLLTTNVAEGSNLYFTNARADARINATSTISTLTSAPSLGTVSTALTGLLKASSGVLSAATAGTDYLAPNSLSATYPIQYSANTISLAFGTTTANSWSSLQTFNGGVKVGSLSGVLYGASGAVNSVATSTATLGSGLSYTGTLGSFIGGAAGTLSVSGLTTSNFASANISQWTNDSGYLTSSGAVTAIKQTYSTNQVGAITLATSSAASSNGVTVGQTITNSGGTFTFTPTVTVANIPVSAIVAQPAFDLTNATNLPIVAGTTGTLTVARGGTGWSNIQSGSLLYGNGTGALSTTTAGTAGQVLALLNGVPTWTSTTTAGTGLSYSSGSFNVNTTQNIAKLSNLTTNGFVKTINGDGTLSIDTNTYLTSAITAIGPAGQTQTGSTITLASSTTGTDFTITASGNTVTFNLPTASASNRGLLSSTDWSTFNNKQAALTFSYPLVNTANTISLAFGTTTANTWNSLQTFNGGITTAGTVTLGSLNGPLQANAGVVSATTSIGVLYGGTGLTSAPTYGQLLVGNSSNGYTLTATSSLGLGTVTSVNASGGTTGLSFSGGPITTSGTLTLSGTLGVANGGTGSTTLSGILLGNGTSAVQTLGLGTGLSLGGGTLSIATSSLFSGTTGQFPYFSGTNTITATSSLFLATSGNIGIGTTTPGSQLTLDSSSAVGQLYINNTGASNNISINLARSSTIKALAGVAGATNGIVTGSVLDDFAIRTSGGNILFSTDSGTTAQLYLKNGGNVGIGTTTPTAKLALAGGNFLQSVTVAPVVAGSVSIASASNGIGTDVQGHYAYSVDAGSGFKLSVIDISVPTSPTVVGSVSDVTNLAGAFTVKVAGNYAYVTATTGGRLTVVDITNPTSPTVVGVLTNSALGGARGLYLSGRYAYVAGNTSGALAVVDITNPTSPTLIGSVTSAGNLDGGDSVYVAGKYAYVTSTTNNKLVVVDITNPAAPTVVGSYASVTNISNPKEVWISGRYAYVLGQASNSLAVIDVSNPASPSLAGVVFDSTNLNAPKDLFVAGRYAYVTSNSGNRLTVVDISNPAAPFVASSLLDATNLNNPRGVFVAGKYAYVSAGSKFTVVDIAGIDVPSANLGVANTEALTVYENGNIGNDLMVRNGLTVGAGGIYSGGSLSVLGTAGVNPFTVASSTGTNLLTLTGAGNLGIGTSSPYAQLSVGGGNLVIGAATAGGTNGNLYLNGLATPAGSFLAVDATGKVIATTTPSGSSLTGTTGQVAYFSGTNTAVGTSTLTIDTTSRVGVGSTSPYAKLSVTGVNNGGGFSTVTFQTTNNLNTPTFTVYDSGSVSIGGAGAFNGAKLQINGTINSTAADTDTPNPSGGSTGVLVGGSGYWGLRSATNHSFNIDVYNSGSQLAAMTILQNGNTGHGTTSPYAQLALGGGNLVLGAATAGGTPGDLYLPKLGTAAGTFLAVDATGKVIATTTPSGASLTGTTGQVAYFSGTNTAVGTSTLTIDTTSRVGVGSTSPAQLLSVSGNTYLAGNLGIGISSASAPLDVRTVTTNNTTVNAAYFANVATGNLAGTSIRLGYNTNAASTAGISGYFNNSGVNLGFLVGSTEAATINPSGNLGIGTSSPLARLSVTGAGTGTGLNFLTANSSNAPLFAILDNGTIGIGTTTTTGTLNLFNTNTAGANPSIVLGGNPGGDTDFWIGRQNDNDGSNNDSLQFGSGLTPGSSSLLTLAYTGNVGIGTTSPYAQLALGGGNLVLGAATAGGTPGDLFLPKLGTAAGSFLAVDATGKVIATTTPSGGASLTGTTGQVAYFSGTNTAVGTSTLFINTAGKVGIGTTNPTALLHITGTQPAAGTSGTGAPTTLQVAGITGGDNNSNTGTVFGGAGSAISLTAGNGGAITGTPSSGFGGTGGNVTLTAGAGGVGGGTSAVAGSAGAIYLVGGAAAAESGAIGGNVNIGGGSGGFTNTSGGSVYIGGGSGTSVATAGNVLLGFTSNSALNPRGMVGIGTSTPWGLLSIDPEATNLVSGAPEFVIGSSSATHLIVTSDGNLGIGTTSPYAALSVAADPSANTGLTVVGNNAGFFQGNIQNLSNNSLASTDWVATADNGDDTTHYIDMGINGSGGGAAPFTGANQAYLYSATDSLNIGALGTGNTIQFYTTGGTSPVERLRIDSAGRVGIGTTTPGYLLNLASSTASQLALSDGSATSNPWTFRSAGSNLYIGTSSPSTFATSSTPTLTLLTGGQSGLVGVGTSTPWAKLAVEMGVATPAFVVSNQGSTTPALFIGSANQNGVVGIGTTTPGSAANFGVAGTSYFGNTLTIASNSASAFAVGATGATNPALVVDASTASSANGLSIKSSASGNGVALSAISSGSVEGLTLSGKGAGGVLINTSTSGSTGLVTIGNSTGASTLNGSSITLSTAGTVSVSSTGNTNTLNGTSLILQTAATTRATLTSGGFGIGTTTPVWNLTVSSSTRPQIALTDGSLTSSIWTFRNTGGTLYIATSSPTTQATSTIAAWSFGTLGGLVGYNATGGDKGIGTINALTVYANNVALTSDARYKTNVQTLSSTQGLDLIRELRPVSYNWKDPSMGTDLQLGFLAQEVQQIAPELVSVGADKDHTLALNYIGLISPAIQAIQTLANETDTLSLATTSLSAQIASLSANVTTSLANIQLPHALTATTVTADSMAIAQGISAGMLTSQSANIDGTVSAARYVVPQTASVFAFGSTTLSMHVPDEALASGGSVDLYKLAGYAAAASDALAARTDLLAVKLDDLTTRVAALEALHAATSTDATTDAQGALGLTITTIQDALKGLGIIVQKGYLALDSLVTHQLFLVKGEDGTSSTGSEIIPAGATSLTVTNPLVHPSSKIFLTFTSSVDGSWYLSKKQEGSFTITLAKSQPADTEFDYFLLQTDPNAQVAAAGQTLPPGSSEAPTVPPSTSQDGGPTVSLNGDAAMQVVQGATWTDPGAHATAADGTDLTSSITVAGTVDANTAGLYTITYNVVDAAGKGGQASRVVTVLAPTTAPSGGSTSGTAVTDSGSTGGTSAGSSADTGSPASTGDTGTTAAAGSGDAGSGATVSAGTDTTPAS